MVKLCLQKPSLTTLLLLLSELSVLNLSKSKSRKLSKTTYFTNFRYLGEGPRMVRDVFRLAKENSPSIIFIDEIDAIATKRFDAQTGADREVQRILLELLNQMDGFDQSVNVKVIMATNRQDTLDPALLRPGRLLFNSSRSQV